MRTYLLLIWMSILLLARAQNATTEPSTTQSLSTILSETITTLEDEPANLVSVSAGFTDDHTTVIQEETTTTSSNLEDIKESTTVSQAQQRSEGLEITSTTGTTVLLESSPETSSTREVGTTHSDGVSHGDSTIVTTNTSSSESGLYTGVEGTSSYLPTEGNSELNTTSSTIGATTNVTLSNDSVSNNITATSMSSTSTGDSTSNSTDTIPDFIESRYYTNNEIGSTSGKAEPIEDNNDSSTFSESTLTSENSDSSDTSDMNTETSPSQTDETNYSEINTAGIDSLPISSEPHLCAETYYLYVLLISLGVNLLFLIIISCVVYRLVSKRGKWYTPPPTNYEVHEPINHRTATGFNLATDDQCKAEEIPAKNYPQNLGPTTVWCVPLNTEKEQKRQADSGV